MTRTRIWCLTVLPTAVLVGFGGFVLDGESLGPMFAWGLLCASISLYAGMLYTKPETNNAS